MKFIAIVFKLVFLVLEVEGSSLLNVVMTVPKQPGVVHKVAIPAKTANGQSQTVKSKIAVTAINSTSNVSHKSKISPQRAKQLRKKLNKTNMWGLSSDKADTGTVSSSHAKVSSVKPSGSTGNKQTRAKVVDTVTGSPKEAVHEKAEGHKATPVPGNHDQAKDFKVVKSPVVTAVKQPVSKALVPAKNSHPQIPKEAKETKSPGVSVVKQTFSNITAPKAAVKESKERTTVNTATANKTGNHSTTVTKVVSHSTAVIKPAPASTPHVLASAGAQNRARVAMGTQNKAEYQLLNFLASEMALKEKKELPPFDEYLPACLEHTHNLIDSLDMAYTDVQLHTVLVDECWLKKSFPKSHDSSFNTDAVCKDFATKLMNARYLELQTGSQEGYEGFCADYYAHKCGDKCKKKAEAPPPEKPKPKSSFPWFVVVVVGVILILFCIILCMVISKRNQNNA